MSSTKYAGIFKRFFAECIDIIIIAIIWWLLITKSASQSTNLYDFRSFAGIFLLPILISAYFVLFEFSLGSTPGKMSLQIAITDKTGGQISLIQSIIRLISKPSLLIIFFLDVTFISGIQGEESPLWGLFFLLFIAIILLLIDCLILVFKPQRQALHDRIAKTVVIDFDGEYKSPQKVLLQLAALAVVSRLILSAVPETPLSWLKPIAPNTAMIAQPSSSPDASTPPVPEPSTSPSEGEAPKTEKEEVYTICRDRVVIGSNSNWDGKWEIQYVRANQDYKVSLSMEGQSGKSNTQFFDSEANTFVTIEQDIKLGTSNRGTWLVGFNPVDAKTKKEVKTYIADNFFLKISLTGEPGGYNCADNGDRTEISFRKLPDK